MSNRRDIEQRAAEWLAAREGEDWSSSEETKLSAWLAESDAHKAAFWRLEEGWRAANRLAALRSPAVPATADIGHRIRFAAAACFAVILAVAGLLGFGQLPGSNRIDKPRVADAATRVGGFRDVRLADGTSIELNTATAVQIAYWRDRREVWLKGGEAYFEVNRDPRRPFLVHAGKKLITVLGTGFGVRIDGSKVVVSVLHGRVRVSDPQSDVRLAAVSVGAGSVAISRGDSTLVASNAESRVESDLLWRDGLLRFDEATLAEAAAEFNRYNDRRIVVRGPGTERVRIGGTFQARNVTGFARLLGDAYGLQVTENKDQILVDVSDPTVSGRPIV